MSVQSRVLWVVVLLVGLEAPVAATSATSAAGRTPTAPAVDMVAGYGGRWELVAAASEVAKGRKLPRGRVDWIQQEGTWLAVRSRSLRDSGDSLAIDYRYRTDGEAGNQVMGQAVRTIGRREGSRLMFESSAKVMLLEFKVRESWSLASHDTLVMVRDTDSPMGKEHQRLVFRRTP